VTYQEVCDRALFQAQRGGEAAELANLNTQSVIEAMMPSVLQDVALSYARNDEGRSLLRRTHTIALTIGVGTVPAEALTQCKWGASISDPVDTAVAQLQSLVPYWTDFVQPRSGLDLQTAWWTIRGDSDFHYLEIGEDYDPADGFTGDIELSIASVPAIPVAAGDEAAWPSEIVTDCIDLLSERLRGAKIAA